MRLAPTLAVIILSATKTYASGAANGEAHHASVTDLVAPAINVMILLGVLAWKLKGPLHSYFAGKAEEVANTLERASLKAKEAQMMIEGESRKLANLQNEMNTIHQQAEADVGIYEKNLSRETDDKTQKLKTDANSKIQADKKALMDELNSELLNRVISKTKSTIKTNKEYQSKVSSNLLQGL